MVRCGLELNGKLLALATSHCGESFHVAGVREILAGRGSARARYSARPRCRWTRQACVTCCAAAAARTGAYELLGASTPRCWPPASPPDSPSSPTWIRASASSRRARSSRLPTARSRPGPALAFGVAWRRPLRSTALPEHELRAVINVVMGLVRPVIGEGLHGPRQQPPHGDQGRAAMMAAADTPVCACGHDRDAHRHYRRGTECALCDCQRWRPGGRLRHFLYRFISK
jgi:hypothetical protein